MKTPEEIKKIELALIDFETTCGHCPYEGEPNGCNRPGGTCKMFDVALDAAEAIEQLEAQQPRWISVKEREPKNLQRALVYSPACNRIESMVYTEVGFITQAGMGEITHWMEIPEPPKEENENVT